MKQIDGVWIPNGGDVCYQWTVAEIGIPSLLVDIAMSLGRQPRSIIHAGGNIGLYAIEFAKMGQHVYVFEPSNENFTPLSLNCSRYENVFLYKAALGNVRGPISVVNDEPDNTGTWRVQQCGHIPILLIDDLGLTDVDIIHLDVEGYELPAIQGAEATILKNHPVLAFELMQHNQKYNYTQEDLFNYVQSLGYNSYKFYCNEVVFVRR